MLNLDNITENNKNHVSNWRELIIGPSRSEKTNYLLYKIQRSPEIIDMIYLYAKDLEETKYKYLRTSRN